MIVAIDSAAPAAPAAGAIMAAAAAPIDDVFAGIDSGINGLTTAEAADRRRTFGPNTVATHQARLGPVVAAQLRSPLLGLLLVAAAVSFVVGERTDAVIIGVIVALSVGLGVVNEYRAAKAADLLHDQVRRKTTVVRDGIAARIDVADLVPGDVVRLRLGDIVPADVRLFDGTGLACDESVLTGESMPIDKTQTGRIDADATPTRLTDLANCALMGTVVHAGTGSGVVVATGHDTEFGKIAAGLRTPNLETEFQAGLRKFSMLLVYVAASLSVVIVARQRRLAPTAARRVTVRACHRRRHHPATAARRRGDQPRHRFAPAGGAQGPGQASGVHRRPRQRRRPVHRQDRHPHHRADQFHASRRPRGPPLRRRPALGPARHGQPGRRPDTRRARRGTARHLTRPAPARSTWPAPTHSTRR